MKKLFFVLLALLISACSNDADLTGTYVSTQNNLNTVTFKSNQIIEIFSSASEKTTTINYEINGDVISFTPGIGTWKFVKNNDGSLTLNNIEKFVKK